MPKQSATTVWITALVPIALKKRMQQHKEVNWSEIIRMAIKHKLEEI